jgi:hypothetical protein
VRIGELSRRTRVSERLLRYYEEQGLLRPGRRPSGYREYGDADVARYGRSVCCSRPACQPQRSRRCPACAPTVADSSLALALSWTWNVNAPVSMTRSGHSESREQSLTASSPRLRRQKPTLNAADPRPARLVDLTSYDAAVAAKRA